MSPRTSDIGRASRSPSKRAAPPSSAPPGERLPDADAVKMVGNSSRELFRPFQVHHMWPAENHQPRARYRDGDLRASFWWGGRVITTGNDSSGHGYVRQS